MFTHEIYSTSVDLIIEIKSRNVNLMFIYAMSSVDLVMKF